VDLNDLKDVITILKSTLKEVLFLCEDSVGFWIRFRQTELVSVSHYLNVAETFVYETFIW